MVANFLGYTEKGPLKNNLSYDNVSGQGSICRQWDFLHESCYPPQVWVEGIIFSQKEKNAAEVMIFPLPQNFFLAIKWPWLVKLLADNMLNIVIKRKREFVNFYDFFQWIPIFEKFLNMLYGVSYIPEKLIPWLSKGWDKNRSRFFFRPISDVNISETVYLIYLKINVWRVAGWDKPFSRYRRRK